MIDLKDRVTSTVILLAMVLTCVSLSIYTRVIFFAAVAIMCMYEEAKHFHDEIQLICPAWVLYTYFVIQTFLVLFHAGEFAYIVCFTAAVYAILFEGVRRPDVGGKGVIYTLSTLLFPGFLFTLIIGVAASDYWFEALLIGCASTWICDSFALFGGMRFGKHKIAPLVSPKKTVEGCVCGALSSIVTGIAVCFVLRFFTRFGFIALPMWFCIAVSLLASTMGQIGDLAESLIKRYVGVKDFSNLIPGHGGMFDRSDSQLWAIPTVYLFIRIFALA